MTHARRKLIPLLFALSLIAPGARAQNISAPPSGDNQRCGVIQGIGLVTVRIDYSSPDVHGPAGEDRAGHIWGELVPYGTADLVYGDCKECPWRAGANENTEFSVSHDVLIEGQPLKAGAYGLHMIPGKDEWTIVFNSVPDAWGSFFHDPSKDVLRVKVKPAKSEYHEWLTYEFTDRQTDHATFALKWENLQVPVTVKVPNLNELYFERISAELRGKMGFQPAELAAGAQFCLQNGFHYDMARHWAERAAKGPGFGVENFNTVSTLALAQLASGQGDEGMRSMDQAILMPDASAGAVHQLGRQLQGMKRPQDALRIFQANHKRFKGAWPTQLGMARGYEGVGDLPRAIAAAKLALPQAPDEPNRQNVKGFIERLEKRQKGS